MSRPDDPFLWEPGDLASWLREKEVSDAGGPRQRAMLEGIEHLRREYGYTYVEIAHLIGEEAIRIVWMDNPDELGVIEKGWVVAGPENGTFEIPPKNAIASYEVEGPF